MAPTGPTERTAWTAQMVRTDSALTISGSQQAIPDQLKISLRVSSARMARMEKTAGTEWTARTEWTVRMVRMVRTD